MPDVENDAALAGTQNSVFYTAVAMRWAIGVRSKTMGQDVPGTKQIYNIFITWRGFVDMCHNWQSSSVSDIQSDFQGRDPGRSTGMKANANF